MSKETKEIKKAQKAAEKKAKVEFKEAKKAQKAEAKKIAAYAKLVKKGKAEAKKPKIDLY